MSRVTTKDEKQPSGVIMRCFYVDGKQVSKLYPEDSLDLELHRRELEQRYGTKAEPNSSSQSSSRKDAASRGTARTAPVIDPMTVAPPKSPARQAREDLYRACFAQKVKFDVADALAVEVGVVEATALIRAHGPDAALASMASRFWADRGVKTALPIPRTTSEVVGGERAAAAYKRRAQSLEPGRAAERASDDFGTEGYASDVYQRREVAV